MDNILHPISTEEKIDNTQPGDSLTPTRDTNFLSLKGYFGLTDVTVEDEDALNWIYSYFEKRGATTMGQILLALRGIEMKIGPATVQGTRAQSVYQYLKTNADIENLLQVKQSMERGI